MPWQSVAAGSASCCFLLPLQVLACQLVLSKETSRMRKYPSLLGGYWGWAIRPFRGVGQDLGRQGVRPPKLERWLVRCLHNCG